MPPKTKQLCSGKEVFHCKAAGIKESDLNCGLPVLPAQEISNGITIELGSFLNIHKRPIDCVVEWFKRCTGLVFCETAV